MGSGITHGSPMSFRWQGLFIAGRLLWRRPRKTPTNCGSHILPYTYVQFFKYTLVSICWNYFGFVWFRVKFVFILEFRMIGICKVFVIIQKYFFYWAYVSNITVQKIYNDHLKIENRFGMEFLSKYRYFVRNA